MCGIAGEIRFDSRPADSQAIARMTRVMAPRGPDGEGLWAHNSFAAGHRRLRIMDLADAAQQPMLDSTLGLGIVFNGAVYNHHELRDELRAMGYSFFSASDTEVLLKAYHAWGENFVARLHGMFAMCIWERDSGRLLLVRDRLGIKPLYYSEAPGRLRFASSLPALLAGGEVDTSIDPVALEQYLSFHAVVPAPHTIVRGVRKLPPATWLRIEADGTTRSETYWSLDYTQAPGDAERPLEEWVEGLTEKLLTAVRRRNVAAVPVGVLLSGGVDSSLLVGLLAEVAPEQRVRTFSVGFDDAGGEVGNEFQWSDMVAERYGTDHTRIHADQTRLLDVLPEVIGAMAEPMVSHDCAGFYLLSEEVSKHIRVVQSGQGADEVFAGYHWYPPLAGSNRPEADYLAAFRDRDDAEYHATVSPGYVVNQRPSEALIRDHFSRAGADDPVDKALRLDTTIMLVDDPVKRVDNMTMRFGLEARVPFLDHELVEFAARIPSAHKLANGGKHVLKEASRRYLPDALIDRPKGYFPVPALKHLEGGVREYVCDALNSQAARERGLFRRDYVDGLLGGGIEPITPLGGAKLWQLGVLEAWLQEHVR